METQESHTGRRKLVLLVDDNHVHQYSLKKHLNESGFEVIQSHTGADTLRQAEELRPDVILLDIHLPDFTGFEVCQKLKLSQVTEHIPIVFHSATYDTQSAKSLAMDLGAMSFLSYPIDIDHLVNVLRGAVARAEAAEKR